eukprot:GHVH01011600.1.p1 GENE.GHVH01011600.1~~GHVH01011600.1.p1  ORF type:complete len:305 (+),score=26.96 GHVH01011600.1:467-1381(+)
MSLISMFNFDTILTKYEKVVLSIVGLGHDAGHFARSNLFLAHSNHPLGALYCNKSPTERYSCAIISGVMKCPDSNLLRLFGPEITKKTKQDIYHYVMATDMRFHVKLISHFNAASASLPHLSTERIRGCMRMFIKMADLGHAFLPINQHLRWSMRVVTEFYQQSDEERHLGLTPVGFMDRKNFSRLPSDQWMFLRYVVEPLAIAIKTWCVPTLASNKRYNDELMVFDDLYNCLKINIDTWCKWGETLYDFSGDSEEVVTFLKRLVRKELDSAVLQNNKSMNSSDPLDFGSSVPRARSNLTSSTW